MRFAAFLRNVNLGRPGKPTQAQLVAAFEAAGATEVRSFRAHGNAAFSASSLREADAIAIATRDSLRQVCGLNEPVFVRSMNELAKLATSNPFAAAPDDNIYERCVSFLPTAIKAMPEIPIVTPRRDAEVFQFVAGAAFSVVRQVGGRPGNVNGLLERVLRTQATTRNWNTVIQLLARHA